MAAALVCAAAPLLLRARMAPCSAPALSPRRLISCSTTADEPPPPARPLASKPAEPESQLPWRDAQAEILRDIEPVVQLIKDILHSDRYIMLWPEKSYSWIENSAKALISWLVREAIHTPLAQGRSSWIQLSSVGVWCERYGDGECVTPEDEIVIVEKLLAYHPCAEDKIGCGLDAIMVDRHPQFRKSRCLFVVRTDGVWIDFSYQKCLRAYIRKKYPSHGERYIREHFKRT